MKAKLFILLILISYGCDINNQKLRLVNKTKDTVYYNLTLDTILKKGQYLYKISPYDTVWPNFVMGRGNGVWEHKINVESKDSTLHIFLFKYDILNDDIIKNHKYKRLDFKVKDLERSKWIIVYQ
jgi:hypothetical protein